MVPCSQQWNGHWEKERRRFQIDKPIALMVSIIIAAQAGGIAGLQIKQIFTKQDIVVYFKKRFMLKLERLYRFYYHWHGHSIVAVSGSITDVDA